MALLLTVIFFLSGAAGVLFEVIWFRLMGLTLGNSAWASSIVLASFMAGLALGNAIAARHGVRFKRPLRAYGLIETVVAVAGVAIVFALPAVSPTLARLFTHLTARPWTVNLLRVTVAFSILCVPATAMGLTLPLIAKAATTEDGRFGRVLGALYGWNTVGGMTGAVVGELCLIEWFGLRGAALVAGGLDLAAAATALVLASRLGEPARPGPDPEPDSASARPAGRGSAYLLGAAFLAGAMLVGLEVVWFRFLQLFVFGTSFIFALMLATVLLGIGLGSVGAGLWLGRDPRAHRFAAVVALLAGLSVELCYVAFSPRVGALTYTTDDTAGSALLFLRLMLPAAVFSGGLFALLGAAEHQRRAEAAEATGRLTVANTTGAMVGALVVGFAVLPRLGMEKTLFAAVLGYGVVGCLIALAQAGGRLAGGRRKVFVPALALLAVTAALFPFGRMKNHFVPLVLERYQSSRPELLAMREGLTETVMYLRESFHGQPLNYRLMTNGHSMSATTYRGRRYMKLYAYWALAVNPRARDALLISYGIGNTAKALTDSRQLTSIDVVDISRDILQLGSLPFPDARPPLSDPRVRVHVEDGRFFLQTTDRKYDLITAEPPPPRGAGVTNLYSREYFGLIHDRLREGGVVTYWLPVNMLWLSETKAIMRGFCDEFPDCTLWTGAGLQWMLAGTRGVAGPIPEEQFAAQWRDPRVGRELAALGFERPESLGATFLADAPTMDAWTEGVAPLDDDHPGRLRAQYPTDGDFGDPSYRSWMDPRGARRRFETSAYIRALWPAALRERTAEYFMPEAFLDDLFVWNRLRSIEILYTVLTRSSLQTLPLLLTGTEPAVQSIAARLYDGGQRDSELEFEMGARAIAERDYPGAVGHLAAVDAGPRAVQAQLLKTLALELLGRTAEARQSLDGLRSRPLSAGEADSAGFLGRLLARTREASPGPSHAGG